MNSIEAANKRFAAIRGCIPSNTPAFRVVHYIPYVFLLDERSPEDIADDIMQNTGFWNWIAKTKPDGKTDINILRDIYNAFDEEDHQGDEPEVEEMSSRRRICKCSSAQMSTLKKTDTGWQP